MVLARLTPFARLLIVVLLVGGIVFAVRKYIPQLSGGDETKTETPAEAENGGAPSENAGDNNGDQTSSAVSSFNFNPSEPVNGKLKGVVELGSTGFNSFIVRVDDQKNWKLEKADFGSSLVYEQLTSDADVTAGLKNYIADMLGFGVGSKDIHFVISSGAQKVEITKKIISALRKMGYVVNTVTPEREGELALRSALPKEYQDHAFVVDIGSGNTKISWMEGGKIKALETYGSKYYQNNVSEGTAYNDALSKSKTIPSSNREVCFIIGGVPFEFAREIRSGKERYTVLKAPGDITPEGEKQKAGLNIYKAVADATGCDTFVFDWDANFTIGFLLTL